MKCPICECGLTIAYANNYTEKDQDDIEAVRAGTLDVVDLRVYRCIDHIMVCTNGEFQDGKPCPNYAGTDLGNPLVIVETVTNKEI